MTLSSSIDQNRYHEMFRELADGREASEVSSGPDSRAYIGMILLLEDEPLIAIDLEYSLVSEGYRVQICTSCDEALRLLEAGRPSLALLDIQLKDGPSTDVAKRLRALDVPFIVCSGRNRAEASDVFADCYWLSKPCASDIVLQKVRSALIEHNDPDSA